MIAYSCHVIGAVAVQCSSIRAIGSVHRDFRIRGRDRPAGPGGYLETCVGQVVLLHPPRQRHLLQATHQSRAPLLSASCRSSFHLGSQCGAPLGFGMCSSVACTGTADVVHTFEGIAHGLNVSCPCPPPQNTHLGKPLLHVAKACVVGPRLVSARHHLIARDEHGPGQSISM